jgi:hypothetical protein
LPSSPDTQPPASTETLPPAAAENPPAQPPATRNQQLENLLKNEVNMKDLVGDDKNSDPKKEP